MFLLAGKPADDAIGSMGTPQLACGRGAFSKIFDGIVDERDEALPTILLNHLFHAIFSLMYKNTSWSAMTQVPATPSAATPKTS